MRDRLPIGTIEQLKAALIARYAHMFPELGAAEIVAGGCAITRLVCEP